MLSIRRDKYLLDCYNSVSEFYNNLKNSKSRPGAENASEDGESYFSRTHSLEEAYDLMIHGDEEIYNRIKNEAKKINIEKLIGNVIKKSSVYNDVVGFQANVPNFILGIPNDMINTKQDRKSQKILNIVINTTVSCGVSTGEIEKAGGYYYILIDLLEKAGYRCNVYLMNNFKTNDDEGYMLVRGKTDREPFNKEKMAFILAHPSFQRRIGFRWEECCNCKGEPTYNGYGRPITNNEHIKSIVDKELKADFMIWSVQDDYNVKLETIIEKLKNIGIKIGE